MTAPDREPCRTPYPLADREPKMRFRTPDGAILWAKHFDRIRATDPSVERLFVADAYAHDIALGVRSQVIAILGPLSPLERHLVERYAEMRLEALGGYKLLAKEVGMRKERVIAIHREAREKVVRRLLANDLLDEI